MTLHLFQEKNSLETSSIPFKYLYLLTVNETWSNKMHPNKIVITLINTVISKDP